DFPGISRREECDERRANASGHYKLPEYCPKDPYELPIPPGGVPGPWTPHTPPEGGPDGTFPGCWAWDCGWGNFGGDIFDQDPFAGRFPDPPTDLVPTLNVGVACEIIANLGFPLPPACAPLPELPSGGGDGAGNGGGGGDGGGAGTGGGGDGGGGGGDFGDINPFDDDLPEFDDWDWYN
ncbi:MAG: hypothetical protein AAGE94_11065, partial [Acidobacteriota bacterium]